MTATFQALDPWAVPVALRAEVEQRVRDASDGLRGRPAVGWFREVPSGTDGATILPLRPGIVAALQGRYDGGHWTSGPIVWVSPSAAVAEVLRQVVHLSRIERG